MDQIKWVENKMPKTDDKWLEVMHLDNVCKRKVSSKLSAISCNTTGSASQYGKVSGIAKLFRQG